MHLSKRFAPLNWIQWLTLLCTLALSILMPIIVLKIQDVQNHQNDALHTIICKVELAQKHSPLLSAQQKRQDLLFWDKALSGAHLASCDS